MTEQKPMAFSDAVEIGAYQLAALWADRIQWPINEPPHRDDELAEVAVMSGLIHRLTSWRPIHIHRAILAGAGVDQVAAAFGGTVSGVADAWASWAEGQRNLRRREGRWGVSDDEYERVAAVFAAVRRGGDPGE